MTRLEFVAALVQSVAWPVVILVVVLTFFYLFKEPIHTAVGKLRHLKAKALGVELEYGVALAEAEEHIAKIEPEPLVALPETTEQLPSNSMANVAVENLLGKSGPATASRVAVIALQRLRSELSSAYKAASAPDNPPKKYPYAYFAGPSRATHAAEVLGEKGVISPDGVEAVRSLERIAIFTITLNDDPWGYEAASRYTVAIDELLERLSIQNRVREYLEGMQGSP